MTSAISTTANTTRFYAIQRNIFSCKTAAQITGCRQWIANYENAGGKEGDRLRKIAATQERLINAREGLMVPAALRSCWH